MLSLYLKNKGSAVRFCLWPPMIINLIRIIIHILLPTRRPLNRFLKSISSDYENLDILEIGSGDVSINQSAEHIFTNAKLFVQTDVNKSYDHKYLDITSEIQIEEKFDLVLCTNTSSFVDLKKLSQFVKNNSRNLNYSGVVLDVIEGDTIASGAGFFISRKNIELILQNDDKFDSSLPDDVAVARILKKFNISPKSLPRRDLKSIPKPNTVYEGSDFHYRCRLDPQFHRILEPLLLKYLNLASQKKGFVIYFYFYNLSLIFKISNIKIINKILQKYYLNFMVNLTLEIKSYFQSSKY